VVQAAISRDARGPGVSALAYANSNGASLASSIYTYDRDGNIFSKTNADGVHTYQYGRAEPADGRVTSQLPGGGLHL